MAFFLFFFLLKANERLFVSNSWSCRGRAGWGAREKLAEERNGLVLRSCAKIDYYSLFFIERVGEESGTSYEERKLGEKVPKTERSCLDRGLSTRLAFIHQLGLWLTGTIPCPQTHWCVPRHEGDSGSRYII